MDEREFRQLLDLFPVVRSRNYCADATMLRESNSGAEHVGKKENEEKGSGEDPFWHQLRLATEREVGPADAERFCKAFKRVHNEIVHRGLTSEAARRFVDG